MPGPEGVHSQPVMEGMLPPFVQERLDQFRRDTVGDEGPSVAESLTGFAHAVAWRDEPWIIGILCGHVLLLAAAITTRHIVPAQVGLFLVTRAWPHPPTPPPHAGIPDGFGPRLCSGLNGVCGAAQLPGGAALGGVCHAELL